MRTLLAALALATAAGCVAQGTDTAGPADPADTAPVPTEVTGWTSATTYTAGAPLPAWQDSDGQHMYILTIRNDVDATPGHAAIHGFYAWIMVDGQLLNGQRPLWVASGGGTINAFNDAVNTTYYGHVYSAGHDGASIHSTGAAPQGGHGGGPGGGDPGGFHFSAYYVNNVILGTAANELANYNQFQKDLTGTWGVGAQAN